MSMVPLLFRDWWDDVDRPSRLLDQHFGLGLRRDDLLSSYWPQLVRGSGYIRPWRSLARQDSGSSAVTVDKDKFQEFILPVVVEPRGLAHSLESNVVPTQALARPLERANEFFVILDVQQFAPSEITVKTVDDKTVVVEGKHEEKQDEHGFVSRHFVRKYLLPSNVDSKDVISNLSSDGVLTITAPKVQPLPKGERLVPIQQTGVPAVKSGETPSSPLPATTAQGTITEPIKEVQ